MKRCPCLTCAEARRKGLRQPKPTCAAEAALASLRPLTKDSRAVMVVRCRGNDVLSVEVRPFGGQS